MNILRNTMILVATLVVSLLIGGTLIGFQIFSLFFPKEAVGSGFFGFGNLGASIISFVVIYTTLIPFSFSIFGQKFRNLWALIFLLPVIWFVIQVDTLHFWFYVLVAAVGWGIGFGVNRLISRSRKDSSDAKVV